MLRLLNNFSKHTLLLIIASFFLAKCCFAQVDFDSIENLSDKKSINYTISNKVLDESKKTQSDFREYDKQKMEWKKREQERAYNEIEKYSTASSYCNMITDEDDKYDCLAGVESEKINNNAEGYCYQIKDEDNKKGCYSGIEIAKGNIDKAERWCMTIRSEDGRNSCYSNVEIEKVQ